MTSPLIRLTKFPEVFRETAVTVPALRWQIFNESHNGLADSGAVVRVGRAVYIDPDRYFAWMRTNPRSAPRARAGAIA